MWQGSCSISLKKYSYAILKFFDTKLENSYDMEIYKSIIIVGIEKNYYFTLFLVIFLMKNYYERKAFEFKFFFIF